MSLEFGIFAPFNLREGRTEHDAFREWLDLAVTADDLGVDCFWLAEFHFRPHTPISAPLVVGSALAQRTSASTSASGCSCCRSPTRCASPKSAPRWTI